MKNIHLIRKQRGLTMISTLIILIIVAFVVYIIGFRVVPIYMEYFKIRKIVEGVKTEVNASSSPTEVQRAIERRFDIDYVTAIQAKDLKISKSRGRMVVLLKYEDSQKLFADLYVVGKFDDVIQLSP